MIDGDRKRALDLAKLRALVREHFGVDDPPSVALAGGAAVHDETRLWAYQPSSTSLGRALALATQRHLHELHLLVDTDGEVLARRGAALAPPARVWRIDGRALVAVEPAPPALRAAAPSARHLVGLLREAGVEVVEEHGEISGEIRGLQVARIGPDRAGAPRLCVGVGRFDQEATGVVHSDLPAEQALINAVSEVRVHRHRHAKPHPVNRLARERWLRAQVLAHPASVGLSALAAVEPPDPRRNIRDPVPAAALGRDDAGERVLVVFSVGIDLDLVPFAADLVQQHRPDRVLLVTPARDQIDLQRALTRWLPVPTELIAVEGDWPS